jgi:cytochrome c553
MRPAPRVSLAGLLAALPLGAAVAVEPTPAQLDFFEKRVRPVLVESCYECHGEKKQRGGLRLDSRAAALEGGDTGPAFVPRDPAKSALIEAIGYKNENFQMPPKKRLADQQIADLTAWVADGAAWPAEASTVATAAASSRGEMAFTPEHLSHWPLQPLKKPAVPAVKNTAWPRTDIDRFILAKLESAGLPPAPPADPATLLRRLTFDLTGLPPTPEELARFSPSTLSSQLSALLASPHHGERYARHWLDVARYADTNGSEVDHAMANAWRYRDYVVRAFNADLPFNRFLREQIAGDLLPGAGPDQITATGFLMLGPKAVADLDKPKLAADIVDEQLDTLTRAFMGLTVSCARCHDHKFDPIGDEDYYALAGIFTSTRTMVDMTKRVVTWTERALGPPEDGARIEALLKTIADLKEQNDAMETPAADKKKIKAALTEAQRDLEKIPSVLAPHEGTIADAPLLIRGSPNNPGAPVPRGFLRVVGGVDTPKPGATASGRRELADWLAHPAHPLTARVIVNRVWLWHFGEGLVRSPDNFGLRGEKPSHPELLDWLATWFIEHGWSLKKLHELICSSAVYQQASRAGIVDRDPDNRLLSHFTRRRLDAESLRDAMLAVSGQLDRTLGGSLMQVMNRTYANGGDAPPDIASKMNYDRPRRSLYLPIVRNALHDFFAIFDYPDPGMLTGQRAQTTVAPQALFLMNSPFVAAQARHFSERVQPLAPDDAGRLAHAYRLAFGRAPTANETRAALAFLERDAAELSTSLPASETRTAAWSRLCHTLLAANEFLYLR